MRKSKHLVFLFFFCCSTSYAGPLDDALTLVLSVNVELQHKQTVVQTEARKKIWDAQLRLGGGYALKQTDEIAGGANTRAQVTFSIPLFDDGGKAKGLAKERASYAKSRDALQSRFLKEISSLIIVHRRIQAEERKHESMLTKLEYFKKAEEAGTFEASGLWRHFQDVASSEQEIYLKGEEYQAELERIARIFGGEQWEELRGYIDAHITNT